MIIINYYIYNALNYFTFVSKVDKYSRAQTRHLIVYCVKVTFVVIYGNRATTEEVAVEICVFLCEFSS